MWLKITSGETATGFELSDITDVFTENNFASVKIQNI